MADEKVPITNNFGGTKFITVIVSMLLLGGMFWLTHIDKLLTVSTVKYYCIALCLTILTGIGGNIMEKLIPAITLFVQLSPEIIKNSWFGRKEIK